MKILAIETSSDACSVALDIDSEVLGEQRIAPQQTVQLLLPMIDQLMAKCGISANALDGVAFGAGPGSFTGLRIAAATAQGIAFGADIGPCSKVMIQASCIHLNLSVYVRQQTLSCPRRLQSILGRWWELGLIGTVMCYQLH